jgi:hypothetical protein
MNDDRKIKEDMASTGDFNGAAGGSVAGIGVGPQGEPPGTIKAIGKKKKLRSLFPVINKRKDIPGV